MPWSGTQERERKGNLSAWFLPVFLSPRSSFTPWEVAAQGNRSPVQQGGASFNSEGEVDLATDGVLAQQCRDKVVKLCIPYSGDNAILSPE